MYVDVVDNPGTLQDPTPDAPEPDDLHKCAAVNHTLGIQCDARHYISDRYHSITDT